LRFSDFLSEQTDRLTLQQRSPYTSKFLGSREHDLQNAAFQQIFYVLGRSKGARPVSRVALSQAESKGTRAASHNQRSNLAMLIQTPPSLALASSLYSHISLEPSRGQASRLSLPTERYVRLSLPELNLVYSRHCCLRLVLSDLARRKNCEERAKPVRERLRSERQVIG
jgi:hypothetical protein